MSRTLRALAAVSAGAVLAACGGGGSTPKAWDPAAVRTVRATAGSVAEATDECRDFKVVDHARYVENAKAIGGPKPLAAGTCTFRGENLEISGFASASDRADFVEERATRVCRSSAPKVPGVRFVAGDDWVVQPDNEATARRLATALGAEYQPQPCGDAVLDWSDRDVAQVERLAAAVPESVGCNDFTLQNRDELATEGRYIASGLPGAYGECTTAGGSFLWLTSFDDTQTIADQFLLTEMQYACDRSEAARVVATDDWGVVVGDGQGVAELATALQGRPHEDVTCEKVSKATADD